MCGATGTRRIHEKVFKERIWHLARCSSCGLHFTDPTPTDEDIAGFYSGDYHEELLELGAAEREFGGKFERYAAWIVQYVHGGRTLDIGCSTGLLPSMLAARGYEAEGVELNATVARWGSARYGVTIHTRPFDGSYEEGAYDLISLTDVLEHTRDPVAFLRLVRRSLKARGHVLVTFPDISSIESRYLRLAAGVLGRKWIWHNCHVPLHVWEFTRDTATACFNRAAFEVAAFRRTQPQEQRQGKFALLSLPVALATLGPASRLTGTQMEFMLRRSD
ncbi:MAG: class I SAM-dependent methyltransferase [Burkholderiales bacterium]